MGDGKGKDWGDSLQLKLLWRQGKANRKITPPQLFQTSSFNLMFSQQHFLFPFFNFQVSW